MMNYKQLKSLPPLFVPDYSGACACPTCGYGVVDTEFRSAGSREGDGFPQYERLRRTCVRCKRQWAEATMEGTKLRKEKLNELGTPVFRRGDRVQFDGVIHRERDPSDETKFVDGERRIWLGTITDDTPTIDSIFGAETEYRYHVTFDGGHERNYRISDGLAKF